MARKAVNVASNTTPMSGRYAEFAETDVLPVTQLNGNQMALVILPQPPVPKLQPEEYRFVFLASPSLRNRAAQKPSSIQAFALMGFTMMAR